MFKKTLFRRFQNISFKLRENKLQKFGFSENLEEQNKEQSNFVNECNIINSNRLIVQAISWEPNLKYETVVAISEKVYIEFALNYLTSKYEKLEVVILGDNEIKKVLDTLKINAKVINVSEKDILFKDNLVTKILGKDVNTDNIPFVDLLDLVYLGRSLSGENTNIILSVFGDVVEGNKVIEVPENTTVGEIFNYLDGNEEKLNAVICGGVYTGKNIYKLDEKIDHSTKGLIFSSNYKRKKEITCIRCSRCLRECPQWLNPIKLNEVWKKKDKEEFMALNGSICSECGICTSICPSNIELAHNIRVAKEFFAK